MFLVTDFIKSINTIKIFINKPLFSERMAKLRKFVAYRNIKKQPYTRVSKFRKKSFVKVRPNLKIVKFNMGNLTKEFPVKLYLKSKENIQIRHNALESARQTSNRVMEKGIGRNSYFLRIRTYPHHILRENPIAKGAGADRMSTGMSHSYGNL